MAPAKKKKKKHNNKKKKTPLKLKSLQFLHTDFDHRIKCRYLSMSLEVAEFLRLVQEAYDLQGAIDGQRDVVRTATATRIRKRMASDLRDGALFLPSCLEPWPRRKNSQRATGAAQASPK
jgi:hypothetical protein